MVAQAVGPELSYEESVRVAVNLSDRTWQSYVNPTPCPLTCCS